MRTTVTIDNDVLKAARAIAASSGKNLGEVISHLAREGLKTRLEVASKNGLPIFHAPTDSASIIPYDRARKILARDEK